MIKNIILQFNWVDIFFILLLLRIAYVSTKNGFVVELFKLLGTIASLYFSLHYFVVLSEFLNSRFLTQILPLKFLDFISCVVVAVSSYLIVMALRSIFTRFVKTEAISNLNKILSLILGMVRYVLIISLLTFMLSLSSVSYFENSAKESYIGSRTSKLAPLTYTWLWNSVVSKIVADSVFNKVVFEIDEESPKE